MSTNPFLQIFTIGCFIFLVVILFFEKSDYLTYSMFTILVAAGVTAIFIPETRSLEFYVGAIDWEVVFFLIGMFTIVEVLNDKNIFQEISKRIVKKYSKNLRTMFYVICITSTLVASILEDLSVAMIFGPIIVIACKELKINPTPFLLGMTVCINLAATLTPFGSAQNILIVNSLELDILYFIKYMGPYFIITTALTLFLLDKFLLKKNLKQEYTQFCEDETEKIKIKEPTEEAEISHLFYQSVHREEESIEEFKVKTKTFRKNLIGLGIFIVLLLLIHDLYIASLASAMMFIFLNPVKDKEGTPRPNLSYYFSKVDYKLIYFFICLFVLVGLMEINGVILLIEKLLANASNQSLFGISVLILIITSILSGFMDNAPVTIIFLPIVSLLINLPVFSGNSAPIIVALILGINLGGNFLPQGSACDMMTLEIARENCVNDLTFNKLFKVGGSFALLHILVGIIYIAIIIFAFPI